MFTTATKPAGASPKTEMMNIIVEGLLETAPEEHKLPALELVKELKTLVSKYSPEVAVLGFMKFQVEFERQINSRLEKLCNGS